MPKKVSFNLLFSIFLFAFLFAATALAQTNACALKMNVMGSNNETNLNGAAATAINTKTKRVYTAIPKSGMPYFARLPRGNYWVTVSKLGYKRSIEYFSFDCSKAINVMTTELYKGSSRQVVKLTRYYEAGSACVTILNVKATNLVKPLYPEAAKKIQARGVVNVQVTVDEEGNVISTGSVSGHPLLRTAAVDAAKASKFSPTLLEGQPVKVMGVVVYNFVP